MQNFAKYLNVLFKFRNNVERMRAFQFSTISSKFQQARPVLRQSTAKDEGDGVSPFGWFLLIVPVSTFSLGVWQVQRKKWKEELLDDMKNAIHSQPVDLPKSAKEIEKLDYKPVRVRGQFLHDKEMYMGPRSLLVDGDSSTQSSLISSKGNTTHGYLVVTPFKLSDRDETILVNRGWVPARNRNQKTRKEGQIDGVVDLIGVVRLQENRPVFSIKNQEGSNTWFYRDLEKMSEEAGTAAIFLDATADSQVKGGPIGGQTRVNLRNEHLSYIITWFSLSAATSYMWYRMVLKKV